MVRRKYLFVVLVIATAVSTVMAGSAAARHHKPHSSARHHHKSHKHHGANQHNRAGRGYETPPAKHFGNPVSLGAPGLSINAPTHKNACPPDPPPGSTVDGGIDVVGVCHLINVTVNGGITVESTGRVELENSTVNGSTDVVPGGELDSGHVVSSGVATFLPSTFNGSVDWNQGSDLDMDAATVNGNVELVGPSNAEPTLCQTTITGKLTIDSLSFGLFGDPGEPFQIGPHSDCPANTIGSFQARNTHAGRNVEVEANSFDGSAQLFSSQFAFWGNTVGGSLQCHDGSALSPDPDQTPNIVHGNNTCT